MASIVSRTQSTSAPVWEFYADGRAQWFECDSHMATLCEEAYQSLNGIFNYTMNGNSYTVNIFNMVQMNDASKYNRRLRRNGKEEGPIPPPPPPIGMARAFTCQLSPPPMRMPEYKHMSDLQFMKSLDGETNNVAILLDESGSMESMKIEARQSVEMFIKELYTNAMATENEELREKLLNVTVVVYTFSVTYNILFTKQVKELETVNISYEPSGATDLYSPLYDILSRNNPTDVLIVSDGENNSGPFNVTYIRRQMNSAKMAGWTFKFIGCNEESMKEAGSLHMGVSDTCLRTEQIEGAPAPLIGLMREQSVETTKRNISRASTC
jgi:hypothetical protein